MNPESLLKIIKKTRKLCEDLLPNLLIYDPLLTLGDSSALDLAVAIILEARRNIGLKNLWPQELDLVLYGCKIEPLSEQEDSK
jgi:hypothetical protein